MTNKRRKSAKQSAALRPMRFALANTRFGRVLVAITANGVRAILLGDDSASLVDDVRRLFPRARFADDDPQIRAVVSRVAAFVDAPASRLQVPLDICGTPFQKRVWTCLQAVPAGSTISYGELAQRIAAPHALRAVAQACASNVHAVAIPCHRVVRANGSVGGYRWGVDRKRALIQTEAA